MFREKNIDDIEIVEKISSNKLKLTKPVAVDATGTLAGFCFADCEVDSKNERSIFGNFSLDARHPQPERID